jgi:hypothetical protein
VIALLGLIEINILIEEFCSLSPVSCDVFSVAASVSHACNSPSSDHSGPGSVPGRSCGSYQGWFPSIGSVYPAVFQLTDDFSLRSLSIDAISFDTDSVVGSATYKRPLFLILELQIMI